MDDNNLDECAGRLVRNACIVLLSTLTLLVLSLILHCKVWTSYYFNKWTIVWSIIAPTAVNALFLSVSFKPTFVDVVCVFAFFFLARKNKCVFQRTRTFWFIMIFFGVAWLTLSVHSPPVFPPVGWNACVTLHPGKNGPFDSTEMYRTNAC